tara:strand:+ start:553 stop:1638 length:1086 start_codon:yes stop_codon:yes gene_type:complete
MKQALLIVAIGAFVVAGVVLTHFYFLQDEPISPVLEKEQPPSVAGEKPNLKKETYPKQQNKPESKTVNKIDLDRDNPSSGLKDKINPSFDVVRVTPEGNIVIVGRGEPNSTVSVLADGQLIGQIEADRSGGWVMVPDDPLSPGSRQLSLEQRIGGEKASVSSDVVLVVVPERKKDIAGEPTNEPSQALALKLPRKGGASKLLQHPIPKASTRTFAVDTVDYDDGGRIHISGRGKSRFSVQLYLDDKFIGRAIVDENNAWHITPDNPVIAGIYQLRADHHNQAGKVVARLSLPFARAEPFGDDKLLPDPFVIVQPGNSLWRLARRIYGSGSNYTVIFKTNKEQIRDPDLIYPGQVLAVPTSN